MSKFSRTGILLMAAAIVASGCANTEELSGRRPEEYKNYGGTPYASDAVNEANLFGTEGRGLSSNPATKPSSALLGTYDEAVGPVTITVVPEGVTVMTNEIVEINVELTAMDEDDNVIPVPKPMQIVVVLESGDKDANGALVWSSKDSAGATLNDNGEYSNKLIITTSKDGKAKFRVQTGTLYNMDDPMYWVNVWSANSENPASTSINVHRPPRIGDDGLSEGSLDVVNDLSLDPEADADILDKLDKSKLGAALMTAKLKTHQELFVGSEKMLAVHLVGAPEGGDTGASDMAPAAGEPICWKVVTDESDGAKNDGAVISPKGQCSNTDDNGDLYVVFQTGTVYNTKYYVNFYHKVASPVSYEIVTFVMPETLGTDGAPVGVSDFLVGGDVPPGMKVTMPSELEESAAGYPMMSSTDSQEILKNLAENDEKLKQIINENCYDPKGDETGQFVCNLVQDDSGSWTIWKQASCTKNDGKVCYYEIPSVTCGPESSDGCDPKTVSKPITADMDGDGVKENVSLVIEEYYKDGDKLIFVDKDGQPYYIDKDGNRVDVDILNEYSDGTNNVYVDKDGNVYDKDGNKIGTFGKGLKDSNGNEILKDKFGYYYMKDGEKVYISIVRPYIDDKGNRHYGYYIDENGNKVAIDTTGKDYYLDKDGNPHDINSTGKQAYKDGDGSIKNITDHGGAFIGYDTTGDGTANTPPDPCTVDKAKPGCSGTITMKFRCSRDGGKSFADGCGVQSYGIQENVDIKTQLIDDKKEGQNSQSVSYTLLRSADERNNGKFTDGKSETEADKTTAPFGEIKGVSGVTFDTGTAHSTQYYVTVINEEGKARPVSYSYYIKYSVKIPKGEGDSPSQKDVDKAKDEPPADMPEKDTSVGDVLILADGATSYNTVIAKTLILKAKIVDANTRRPYGDTDVYWKVVRGASESNNGVLKNTKTATDSGGYAMNEFFTGTGYNSTYYAIAYHPNCKEENGCEPLVFSIHTEDFGGTVEGPTGDPTSPCDPETDEHQCKAVFSCKDDPKKECDEDDPNANKEDGPTKVDGIDIIKKYPSGPDAVCTDADLVKIKKCMGSDASCDLGKEKGCLLFELLSNEDGAEKEIPTALPGEEVRQANTNAKENINARLSWFDGAEWNIVDSRLYWTLDKSDQADASMMYMKTFPGDNGVATNTLKTGSVETKYRVNVSFPNIYKCEDDEAKTGCKMEPLSTVVNVSSSAFKDGENFPANKLNLTFNKEIKTLTDAALPDISNVEIYVVSSELNTCNANFVFQSKKDRETEYGTMLKGRNEKISEDKNTWDVLTEKGKSFEIADQREALMVYTIATDASGNPIAYNCTENLNFPIKKKLPAKCGNYDTLCTGEAKKDNEDLCASCTNEINKEITLTEVPMSVEGSYYTKTLFDIGGMLANDNNIVHKKLLDLATKYKKFMLNAECKDDEGNVVSCTVGEQIVNKLFSYLVFEDVKKDSGSCYETFCKGKWNYSNVEKCLDDYKDKPENRTLSSNEIACNTIGMSGDNGCEGKNLQYKECGCICGKTYYYTQIDSFGKMLTPLIKKGLAKLVDSALGTDDMSMDDMMCSVFDSIQFIEFTGNVSLKASASATTGYEGAFEYSGLVLPAVGDLDSQMSVIRGKWESATLKDDQLTFNNTPVMLSYGKLAYQVLGKLVGLDESGKINLLGFINCESIFSSDLSLPIIGSFDASGLQELCKSYVHNLSGQFFEFADAKETTTNITFDSGVAKTSGKSSNCSEGKCQASTLINGTWEGSGTYKATDEAGQTTTKKYDASALWFAALSEADLASLVYNTGEEDKDLDAWKKEHSVCANILDQGAKRAKVQQQIEDGNPTNQACLGGTFNGDSKDRSENNFCNLANCLNNASIVVCSSGEGGGQLNDKYANTNKDAIISDAMSSCYRAARIDKTANAEDQCNKNAEVEGWDVVVTNAACKAQMPADTTTCSGPCADAINTSIVVCSKETSKRKCTQAKDGYACFRKWASKACSDAACAGDCMNNVSEAVVCGEKEERVLAAWTDFDNNGKLVVFNEGKANDTGLSDAAIAGMLPDANSCNAPETVCAAVSDLKLKVMIDDGAKIKVVAGSDNDGAVSALGISKLGNGSITIDLPKRVAIWPDDTSEANNECSDYQITMKIRGDGRRLKAYWNNMNNGDFGSGITTNDSYKLFKPADAKSKFYSDGDNPFTIVMDPTKPDESNKMLRIDEIKITAMCWPYSDPGDAAPAEEGNSSNNGQKQYVPVYTDEVCVDGQCVDCEGDWCDEENLIACDAGVCRELDEDEIECWPDCY